MNDSQEPMTGSDVEVSRMSQDINMAQPVNPHDWWEYAKVISRSDIVPKSYAGKPSNVLVAMDFGQSMGLTPAESLYRIHVIQGTPTMSGELIASCVRLAGHKLRVKTDEKAESVSCTIIRKDDPEFPFTVTRDMAWAKRMGLANRPQYRMQPLTMLQWRAVTACARIACPECLFGAGYTPEEIEDPLQKVESRPAGEGEEPVAVVEPEVVGKTPVKPSEGRVDAGTPPTVGQPPVEPVPEYVPQGGDAAPAAAKPRRTERYERMFTLMHEAGLVDKQSKQKYLSDQVGVTVEDPRLLTLPQIDSAIADLEAGLAKQGKVVE